MFGPIEDILKRNEEKYKQYISDWSYPYWLQYLLYHELYLCTLIIDLFDEEKYSKSPR